MKHYIVVRFNLGLYRTGGRIPDDWFADRIKIFNTLTIPSLKRQTNQNFALALLVDNETPRKHADRIIDIMMSPQTGGFQRFMVPIRLADDWRPKRYGERWSCAIDYSVFMDHIRKESKSILQTRLDNDDALMPNAIETIQDNCAAAKNAYCIDFVKGYVIDSKSKDAYNAQHNAGTPFISLYQPVSDKMKCIYDLTHQKIMSVFPCIELRDRIWIMNIHEYNVSNRLFPWLIEDKIPYDSIVP